MVKAPILKLFILDASLCVLLFLLPLLTKALCRMNRRKADFKFVYKFLEDDV
jgi:hypothetical protein